MHISHVDVTLYQFAFAFPVIKVTSARHQDPNKQQLAPSVDWRNLFVRKEHAATVGALNIDAPLDPR